MLEFVKAASQPHVAAGISIPSAFVAWFAENLPMLQGLAAIVAILVGGVALLKAAVEAVRKLRR